MRALITTAIIALAFMTPAFAQGHAPTVEQCQADSRVWMNMVTNHIPGTNPFSAWSYNDALNAYAEMHQCFEVVEDNLNAKLPYSALQYVLLSSLAERLTDFVNRHKYSDAFLAEDAAGQR
jgi:hypothetical protein